MEIKLTNSQTHDLTSYIDRKLSERPCDHSLSNAIEWAKLNEFEYDEIISKLEKAGFKVVKVEGIDLDLGNIGRLGHLGIRQGPGLDTGFVGRKQDSSCVGRQVLGRPFGNGKGRC